jgi:tetratricopeptide (TPR) repeat protein
VLWLIPVAVLAAYWPSLGGALLWDDPGHITRPDLQSLEGLWRIWTEIGATQQYYPLLHSAFWLEHRLWGDVLIGYRLANVALHSTAAVLLAHILKTLQVRGAIFAAFVFALHPICVESVAWISEQKNTLSTVFYLASGLVYVRARTVVAQGVSPAVVRSVFVSSWYWLALALFICALLTKTVTATLPAALLLITWWHRSRAAAPSRSLQLKASRGRGSRDTGGGGGAPPQTTLTRGDVLPLVPWFVVGIAGGLLTAWFEREVIGASGQRFELSMAERCVLAGRVVWFYLSKLFWPRDLMFVYPRWDVAVSWPQILFPITAVAVALGLAVARWRGALTGYLYFCGTLVPVLGFFNVFPFVFSYVADHFQYLASLGVIVTVSATLVMASEHVLPSPAKRVGAVALVAVLGMLTWQRSTVYTSAETLFRDAVARNPGAWMAYQNLGAALANQNRLAEAIEAFDAAVRLRPDYDNAKRNLALAHMRLGDAAAESTNRTNEAIRHYEAVLAVDADHFRAHYNLGTLLMDVSDRQHDAIGHLESAVRLQPDNVEARVNLGIMVADVPARSSEAITHLEFALGQRPDLVRIRELLDDVRSRTAHPRKK